MPFEFLIPLSSGSSLLLLSQMARLKESLVNSIFSDLWNISQRKHHSGSIAILCIWKRAQSSGDSFSMGLSLSPTLTNTLFLLWLTSCFALFFFSALAIAVPDPKFIVSHQNNSLIAALGSFMVEWKENGSRVTPRFKFWLGSHYIILVTTLSLHEYQFPHLEVKWVNLNSES